MQIETTPVEEEYKPSPAQSSRAQALRRHNWLYVYTPIIVAAVLALVIVIFLLWAGLTNSTEDGRQTISGIADIILIITAVPMVFLCGLGPGLAIYIYIEGRKRKMAPLKRTQRIFWKVDNIVAKISGKVGDLMPQLAQPVINAHGIVSFIKTFLKRLASLIGFK